MMENTVKTLALGILAVAGATLLFDSSPARAGIPGVCDTAKIGFKFCSECVYLELGHKGADTVFLATVDGSHCTSGKVAHLDTTFTALFASEADAGKNCAAVAKSCSKWASGEEEGQ
jgi:hypothetical protein